MWLSKHGFQVLELVSFNVKAGVFDLWSGTSWDISFAVHARGCRHVFCQNGWTGAHSRGAICFLINVGSSRGCPSEVVSHYVVTNGYKTLMGVVTLLAAVVPLFISTLLRIEAVGVL